MDFKLDENILWIAGILAVVFFLFPLNKSKEAVAECSEKVEKKAEEKNEYIYRRKNKERRKLVY